MLAYFNIFMTWLSLGLLVCALLCKVSRTGDYYVKLFFLYVAYFLTGTLLIPHGKSCRNRGLKHIGALVKFKGVTCKI